MDSSHGCDLPRGPVRAMPQLQWASVSAEGNWIALSQRCDLPRGTVRGIPQWDSVRAEGNWIALSH